MKTILEVLLEECKEFHVKNFSEGIYHIYCITNKDVRYDITFNELQHNIVVIDASDYYRTVFIGSKMAFLYWWYKEEKL